MRQSLLSSLVAGWILSKIQSSILYIFFQVVFEISIQPSYLTSLLALFDFKLLRIKILIAYQGPATRWLQDFASILLKLRSRYSNFFHDDCDNFWQPYLDTLLLALFSYYLQRENTVSYVQFALWRWPHPSFPM